MPADPQRRCPRCEEAPSLVVDIASNQDNASTVIDRTALWLESLTTD